MDKTPATAPQRRASTQATRPDYGIWAVKDTWSVSEAAKILCGRNPHDKIPGPQQYNRERRVIDIIDAAFAAAQTGQIRVVRSALLPIHLLVEPASFVRWALSEGLQVPEPLVDLSHHDAPPAAFAEAIVKERVQIIARTLWVLFPELSVTEIATHRAMRQLVPESDALMTDKLRWLEDARS
jgi:hypothetical protein